MFIQNKYYIWYYSIINNAKVRSLSNNIYSEKHHIIPKSLGGNNNKENLVILTAREHFICHLLLIKFTKTPYKSKMINAAWSMVNLKTVTQQRIKVNSHTYSILREQFSKKHSEWRTGKKHSEETKLKISKANKGKASKFKGIPRTTEIKNKISKACKGIPKSKEHKAKLSKLWSGTNNPNYGKTWSAQTRKLISESKLKQPKIMCDFCKKSFDAGNYKQWHGENCKFNPSSHRYIH